MATTLEHVKEPSECARPRAQLCGQTKRPSTVRAGTVKPATKVRDFYKAVVGWKTTAVDMGGYSDFCMNQPSDGKTVAGICHARGENTNLPPQWLIYINVASLKRSLAVCRRCGGKIICTRDMGSGKIAVIRDPAGAVAALFEHEPA